MEDENHVKQGDGQLCTSVEVDDCSLDLAKDNLLLNMLAGIKA